MAASVVWPPSPDASFSVAWLLSPDASSSVVWHRNPDASSSAAWLPSPDALCSATRSLAEWSTGSPLAKGPQSQTYWLTSIFASPKSYYDIRGWATLRNRLQVDSCFPLLMAFCFPPRPTSQLIDTNGTTPQHDASVIVGQHRYARSWLDKANRVSCIHSLPMPFASEI